MMHAPILTPPESEWIAWLKPGDQTNAGVCHESGGSTGGLWARLGDRTYTTRPILDTETHSSKAGIEPPETQLDRLNRERPDVAACHMDRACSMMRNAGFDMFPGQFGALLNLAATRGAVIAAEVGCGKTAIAIGLIHVLQPTRCLVIAPQGVVSPGRSKRDDQVVYNASQWQREFNKFAPWLKPRYYLGGGDPGPGVVLTYTQDALLNDGGWLRRVPPDYFDMIVVDEAHLVADPSTKMAQALFRMQPKLRFALTATPMPNHPGDADALCKWVRPDVEIKPMGFAYGSTCLSAYASRLRHAIAPIRKIDIRPNMPPLTIVLHEVDAEPGFREQYEAELVKIRDTKSCGQAKRMQITALRGVCAGSTARARAVAGMLGSDGGSLCVSARTAQTSLISSLYEAMNPNCSRIGRIDSTSDPKMHGSYSAAFQAGNLDVLFMGIKCAYGHSFPATREVVIASLEWCHGSLDQALGRVYRINSEGPVTAHIVLVKDTIEREMFERVCAKRNAIEAVLFGSDHQPARVVTAAPVCAVGG